MSKEVCEEQLQITVKGLKRMGYLDPVFRSGVISWTRNGHKLGSMGAEVDEHNNALYVRYVSADDYGVETSYKYYIPLTATACNYGGERFWFRCPYTRNQLTCYARVANLYLVSGIFRCRMCADLAYRSQQYSRNNYWDYISKLCRLEEELCESYESMRNKYWLGAPNRRYRSWLRRYSSLYNVYKRLHVLQDTVKKIDSSPPKSYN